MADVDSQQLPMLLNTVGTLAPLIREYADEAERHRRLSRPVVTALAEAGIFRMYIPYSLGGLEVNPLTFCRVVEAIARIDRGHRVVCLDCRWESHVCGTPP